MPIAAATVWLTLVRDPHLKSDVTDVCMATLPGNDTLKLSNCMVLSGNSNGKFMAHEQLIEDNSLLDRVQMLSRRHSMHLGV